MSATDDERLPPGGFSLRHGFPHWFGRAEKSIASSTISSRTVSGTHEGHGQNEQDVSKRSNSGMPSSGLSSASMSSIPSTPQHQRNGINQAGIVDVLQYVKRAFDDETTMDSLPLEAAGNPGAWNAWRAHRKSINKASDVIKLDAVDDVSQPGPKDALSKPALKKAKQPSEWNWDGVWRERVQKGIDASISSSVLYGTTSGADDLVR